MSKNSPSYKRYNFIHIIIDDTGEEQIIYHHKCSKCISRSLRDGRCFNYYSPYFNQPVSQEVCSLYKEEKNG